MKKKSVFSLFLLALAACSSAQQVLLSSEKLNELDSSELLAGHTDYDRLSKAMFRETATEQEEFNPVTMADAISNLLSSEEIDEVICSDLRAGDGELGRSLQTALVALNVPSNSASVIVEKWATYGPDEALGSLLASLAASPEASSSVADYLYRVDPDWIKLTRGVSSLVTGESEAGREALANAVANATGQSMKQVSESIKKARAGEYSQLWNLTDDSKKILTSRGALAREIISQQNSAGSLYALGWQALTDRVSISDPETRSYIRQSLKLMPLYNAYRDCLASAMSSGENRSKMVGGIILGSPIPSSRFRWMVEELSGKNYETFNKDIALERTAKVVRGDMTDNLKEALEKDPIWPGVILWHLTRPGEAVALATRLSLPEALSTDPDFAQDYIKAGTPLGSLVDRAVQARGGYSYYPGGRVEMIEKTESGEVTREALLLLSKTIAETLATDDRAWDSIMGPNHNSKWAQRLVVVGIERVPLVGSTWAQTMIKNDLALGQGFKQWVTENKALGDDRQNADTWLNSIASGSSSAEAFGNAEVAKFKKMFQEYITTPAGWSLLHRRLLLEGVAFPGMVRDMLAESIVTNPDAFWKLFRILTSAEGDSMARLRPYLENYISSSQLPQMILDETAAENAFAADASASMWKNILQPGSPIMDALVSELTNLRVKTEPHSLANLCFVEEISSPEGWKLAQPSALAMLEKIRASGVTLRGGNDRDQLLYALTNHAEECGWAYELMLKNKDFRSSWENRVITKVLFMGKAPAVAWLVKQNTPLMETWRTEMGKQIAQDPYLLRAFVDSLVTRRIGDREWVKQVNSIRREIATAVFYDRILVEQMLGVPEKEYRSALGAELGRIFDQYVADQWKDIAEN
jgi:hypothetical protein